MQKPGRKKRSSALPQNRGQKAKARSASGVGQEPSPKTAGNGDRAKVVTITDVAQRARVGESTVSRVLRNRRARKSSRPRPT
jgi:ribosomal protein S25